MMAIKKADRALTLKKTLGKPELSTAISCLQSDSNEQNSDLYQD